MLLATLSVFGVLAGWTLCVQAANDSLAAFAREMDLLFDVFKEVTNVCFDNG
jgi:hypothetical protein